MKSVCRMAIKAKASFQSIVPGVSVSVGVAAVQFRRRLAFLFCVLTLEGFGNVERVN